MVFSHPSTTVGGHALESSQVSKVEGVTYESFHTPSPLPYPQDNGSNNMDCWFQDRLDVGLGGVGKIGHNQQLCGAMED